MKVSVIIPTFNRRKLILDAVNSVLRQSYSDIEIIVVDDGSNDGTAAMLEENYGDAVICLQQSNKGLGAARNRGVSAASGKYIAFLDSDDLWQESKLGLQVEVMEKLPDLGFTFTDFIIFNDSGKIDHSGIQTWFAEPKAWEKILPDRLFFSKQDIKKEGDAAGFNVYVGDLYYHLMSQCYVLPSTAMVRANCLSPGIRHTENDPYCSDWDFFALLSRKWKAGFIECETAFNRSHDDSVRLTRAVGLQKKIMLRLASLERVWKTDSQFMQLYAEDLYKVEGQLWLQLAKHMYLCSNSKESKRALAGFWRSKPKENRSMAFFLGLLNLMPKGGKIAQQFLKLRS